MILDSFKSCDSRIESSWVKIFKYSRNKYQWTLEKDREKVEGISILEEFRCLGVLKVIIIKTLEDGLTDLHDSDINGRITEK